MAAIDQMALIDILNNLQRQSPPPISPAAQGGSGMGTFADMMQRNPVPPNVNDPKAALLQQAFAPEAPQMLPEEPQWSRGREVASTIGAALADALGAYASGMGAPVRINASQQLQDRIMRGRVSREENQRRKKSSEDESKRARARYELGRLEQGEQQKRQDELRADDRAFDLYRESGRIGAQEDREARARQFEAKQAGIQAQYAKELAMLRGDIDLKVERARQAGKSDVDRVEERRIAQEQRTAANEIMASTSEDIDMLPQALAEKKVTPDAVRNRFLRGLRIRGLDGEQKQRAMEFFQDNVEPILQQFDPVQGPQDNPNRQAEEVRRAEEKFRAAGGNVRFPGKL